MDNNVQKARDLVSSGNFEEGLNLYSALPYPSSQTEVEYASAAAHSGDFDLAHRIWERLHNRERKNAKALVWLAVQYAAVGMLAQSSALYREAANLEPGNLELQSNLAWELTRRGNVQVARPLVNTCLELGPGNETARFLSAQLDRREGKLAAAEQQCRDLLASGLRFPRVRYACHAELAYILDQTERFDEAMTQLEQGKNFLRQNIKPPPGGKEFYAGLGNELRQIQSLPKNILQGWSESFPPIARTEAPPLALLTGFARSGTTLLERILDAHPAVAACDETPLFENLLRRMDLTAPTISPQRLNVLRQLYVKSLELAVGLPGQNKTLLDKNPTKTHWLPLFLRIFPELRVLVALRDPRDILVSLYFQDQPTSNFLTLEELAETYPPVMNIWLTVREWEGLNWMETRYEDIVKDLEKEGRRVTQFLGLEWDEKQARFHERNREKPVSSNNFSDISKPVYNRAVGRWRNYEKHLAASLPVLEPHCRKFGYA